MDVIDRFQGLDRLLKAVLNKVLFKRNTYFFNIENLAKHITFKYNLKT